MRPGETSRGLGLGLGRWLRDRLEPEEEDPRERVPSLSRSDETYSRVLEALLGGFVIGFLAGFFMAVGLGLVL
jgi:hypothetical protein